MPHKPQPHRPRRPPPAVERPTANERGYNHRWQVARRDFLRDHPLCEECLREGKLTPATVVDHRVPHRGDEDLFWERSNWAAMCKPHHDSKTGRGQ